MDVCGLTSHCMVFIGAVLQPPIMRYCDDGYLLWYIPPKLLCHIKYFRRLKRVRKDASDRVCPFFAYWDVGEV